MKRFLLSFVSILFLTSFHKPDQQTSWIRINQLGYATKGIKVAVWCSKDQPNDSRGANGNLHAGRVVWQLVDAGTNKVVYTGGSTNLFGAYGPFLQTCRLDFSPFTRPGHYLLRVAGTKSPEFEIGDNVYKGA